MRLYNPISQQTESFVPQGDVVTLYTCGITPYDTTHLGHAFTYNVSDILIRYLEYRGYTVRYVQNVTDIDDDILRKSKEAGEDWIALGNRWTRHFLEDLRALNIRPPDAYPRATEVMDDIIAAVEKLLDVGVAYVQNGSVYYHTDCWGSFGELSHLSKDEMLATANERGNNPDDPNKRDPLDFVLWQAQSPGEPAWDSPWGPGRPGWHIECSSMSSKFLGDTIDFHSGGGDLLFPHHECEIAQIEPITGKKPFVRFWLHAAMVRHQGEKMSKSLGNLVWARQLLETYHPDVLRLYIATHHYQTEWSYDQGKMDWAERIVKRLTEAVTVLSGNGSPLDASGFEADFVSAMDDNLNSPAAIGILDDLGVRTLVAAQAGKNITAAQRLIRALSTVFGLRLDAEQPEPRVMAGWTEHLKKFP
jgi:L-cysteine:1D-myo-inositol 2-amino-2-deoxy-alpha-D-glucopyranoside ligase